MYHTIVDRPGPYCTYLHTNTIICRLVSYRVVLYNTDTRTGTRISTLTLPTWPHLNPPTAIAGATAAPAAATFKATDTHKEKNCALFSDSS